MKTCSKCKTTKSRSEFAKRSDSKDGLKGVCKACDAEYHKEWNAANKDHKRSYERMRLYGLDNTNFGLLWDTQKGACAICEEVFLTPTHSHVDHNHTTGAVRGLLCSQCNTGLGLFYDSKVRLQSAIHYLDANP